MLNSVEALHSLRTAGGIEPLGRPGTPPVLTWSVAPDADVEPGTSFRIEMAGSAADLDIAPLWTTETRRPWAVYDGPPLLSRQRAAWRVRTRSRTGATIISAPSCFEVGLLARADWTARWVSAPLPNYPRESWDPCPYLRREFDLPATADARLYVTALGLYRAWLNDVEITGDALLRPGWTDYRKRVYHQTYDCTRLLRPGRNVLALVLAKGWYAGRLGLLREPGYYGTRPALLAQLECASRVVLASDETWRAGHGAILATDLLRGELQDLRQEPVGWRRPGFDDEDWQHAELVDHDGAVSPQPHDSISHFRLHPGQLVHEHARGPAVFDFGQNLVGWARIRSSYLPSVELIVRHGEILTPDKLVYRDNLRGAFQEDRYVVPDAQRRELEPSFTLHGFRYAEVWGLPSVKPYGSFELVPDTEIEAVSVTGLPNLVGSFSCSNERLTRLASNIEWTVRDNFLEVATDCPQRDERHGWLGDAGTIAASAAYHFDLAAFLAKFTQDAADTQGPGGEIRNYAPAVPPTDSSPGAPGWSDGYIRLVHLLVTRYADLPTAERLYASMRAFLDHVDRANPDGLRVHEVGADFGDWLSLPEREGLAPHRGYAYTGAYSTTPQPIVDTAHSYRSFVQLAEIAARLGRVDDAARLAARAAQIRAAYRDAFVLPDASIKDATQTAYAQAIGFGLLDGDEAHAAASHLRAAIERVGHITTGIHGVQHVLPALASHGHTDFAIQLLLREEQPSWLHMVRNGATTIWEKWDGIDANGTLSTAEMNSFNHCALGAVGEFLFEGVAGLDASDTMWTGEVHVRATYTPALQWVRASYTSPLGSIGSAWRWHDGLIEHELEIPGCAHAVVTPPKGYAITGTTSEGRAGGLRLGPGSHRFTVTEVTV